MDLALGGEIVTGVSGHADTSLAKASPHPVRRDARLSGDDACALCHEFQFPDARLRRVPELMQLTMEEHRASVHATTLCIDCHMPKVANAAGVTHRSHAFLGGHDEKLVRSALHIKATRAANTVTLRLTPQRVGHAFPTGDLFRRLVVTVGSEGKPGLPEQQRDLQRHFTTVQQLPGHPVRVTERDDRVTGPTEVAFPLPPDAMGRYVRWRVTYQRVAFPIDQRGGRVELDGEIVLASGSLPPCATRDMSERR